ncbi:MAG: tryptophan transporter [Peptoniphilaceae bacterium]|nr:tryptophan transporter [Peptoniphilaceae bacterium]MDD7382942.1 tryptophan transporter [Peptoniphilaceae bacterium]MDY3737693.1 tryptophan transporter [Peptoniphilaceae bacterium]
MNTKKLVTASVLLALGFILHIIAPPLIMGIKPDFLLAMMFLAIFINPDIKNAMIISIAAGILTGITTTLPNGLLANLIDKIITGFIVYNLTKFTKFNFLNMIIISIIGTYISGTLCLLVAFLGDFTMYFANLPVVIITALLNGFIVPFIYKLEKTAIKKS